MACVAIVCMIGLGDRRPLGRRPSAKAAVMVGSRDPEYAAMCAVACAGEGHGTWGAGGSRRTCAVCRLADKQARLGVPQAIGLSRRMTSLGGMVWSTVEDDHYGVSTPTFLPAGRGDDDALVDGDGMIYFPEEFSGCNDNGDSDDFRNDEVNLSAAR